MGIFKFIFSKTFVKQLIIALGLVVLLMIFLIFYLKWYTNHGESVEVPSVIGMKFDEANDVLSDQSLKGLVIDSVYSENAIGGTILEQNPLAEAKVKENRTVYLTVFRTTPPTEIVKVKEGMSEDVAKIILQNKGIKYETVYESNRLLSGMVIRVVHDGDKLMPDDRILRGEKVNLIVGKKNDDRVAVPDLLGLTYADAESRLMSSGLSIGYPFYDDGVITQSDSSLAKVYAQTPSASSGNVRSGTTVDLYLGMNVVMEQDSTSTE